MLLHNPPNNRQYLDFVAHLQELENRRRYYQQPTVPLRIHQATTTTSTTTRPTGVTISPNTIKTLAPRVTTPMDLSNTRPYTDKKRGTYYLYY